MPSRAQEVKNYLGGAGYWLVMLAAVLSTLSALHASLLAASRVAYTMARDRTLPRVLAQAHRTRHTPLMAIYTSFVALAAILFMVPNLAAAGAAASLICGVVKTSATQSEREERRRMLQHLAEDETYGATNVDVLAGDDVVEAIVERAEDADLVILGLQRHGGKKLFGEVALRIARSTQAATLMMSRGG